jgi:hypothetical protein
MGKNMKKLIFVLLIGLLVGTAAFADHSGLGIGIVGGGGWGGVGTGNFGLSLKIPRMPVFWGIYFPFYADAHNFGMGITGDFYIFDRNLVTHDFTNEDGTYKFKLDWYLGLGGFFSFHTWRDTWNNGRGRKSGGGVDFGLRVPIGLSWHIIKPLELFLGIHPGLGFYITDKDYYGYDNRQAVYFNIGGEIGLRLWIGA